MWVRQGAAHQAFTSLGEGVDFAEKTIGALPIYTGLQFDARWGLKGGSSLAAFARAAWMHDLKSERSVDWSLSAVPDVMFHASGMATVDDAGVARLGLRYQTARGVTLSGSADIETSGAYRKIGGTLTLRVAW